MVTASSRQTYECRARNIATEKYKCVSCNKCFRSAERYNNHMNGFLHNPSRLVSYSCIQCGLTTKFKAVMSKHLLSQKHARILARSD